MEDDVDGMVCEDPIDEPAVADVTDEGCDAVPTVHLEGAPIEDDHAMAGGEELADAEATDVPGTAGDEDVQGASRVRRLSNFSFDGPKCLLIDVRNIGGSLAITGTGFIFESKA